jgi:peptide deformylase
MSLRKIELLGSPALRTPAEEVENFDGELEKLVRDMLETMYHAQGIGLAAPQVGVSQRVVVVDPGEAAKEEAGQVVLVNPRVVEASKAKEKGPEGCLSIPGLEEVVERPLTVKVDGLTPKGEPVMLEVSGILSRVIQHEIDHLDGILFIDRVSPLKRRLLLKKWKKSREEESAS